MLRSNVEKLKFVLALLQVYLASAKEFVWLSFMSDQGKEIIEKQNFYSMLNFEHGNIFPLLFFIILVVTAVLHFIKVANDDNYKYKKIISSLESLGLVFLLVPILTGMQKINIGLFFMLLIQFIQVHINYWSKSVYDETM